MSQPIITQHSSHLWISDPTTAEQHIIANLQQVFCTSNKCLECTTCLQIQEKTYPAVHWLEPENSYTLDQVDEIIKAVQFKLDTNEKRFFVFTQAQELTPACCNRLLKTIEEPHPGYHFIFATHQAEQILPTLRSRCLTQSFQSQHTEHTFQELLQPFYSLELTNPIAFMRIVDKQEIKERATKEILDLLLEYFHKKFHAVAQNSEQRKETLFYLDIIILLKESLQQLPLPGSTKLFWKNLYISFHHTLCLKK